MTMRVAMAILCLALSPTALSSQEIAITLDDLPYVMPSRTSAEAGLAQVAAINDALDRHGITATGFAIGGQLNERTIPALRAFAEAGHVVGNHSWSHPDYGTLTPEAFRAEIARTDTALAAWIGDGPRLYRFPFLREGETEAAKAAAAAILADLGYRNVPVTIDNDEWRFNADYMDALDAGDLAAAETIAAAYVDHMRERSVHFRDLARAAFGRDVAHILLLHMNRINADHLPALLYWYAAEGWTFVTVEHALADPLYAAPDLYAGPRGLSQIERVMGQASE
ncbi:MAG: polysaccharide deacetylase family protein [Pseudomonadota bacterium]